MIAELIDLGDRLATAAAHAVAVDTPNAEKRAAVRRLVAEWRRLTWADVPQRVVVTVRCSFCGADHEDGACNTEASAPSVPTGRQRHVVNVVLPDDVPARTAVIRGEIVYGADGETMLRAVVEWTS